ncbi:hypothetical protein [Methylococcus sp. EFPC2]|uniref:hypothetical protein n=1 Tax=Methylococcus sp. EFPC2 TaxID=2812648 RepID=UPI001F083499|nr:hypothetical protein [Methylococcus sp. EFPC2]
MRLARLSLCTALCLLVPSARAADLWSGAELKSLCERLEPVNPAALSRALGPYLTTLHDIDRLSIGKMRTLPHAELDALLARASQSRLSVLEIFSQAAFAAPDGCALFMDKQTLAEANKRYDLHGVWQLAATLAEDPTQTMAMDYMIVGLGRLVVGYPKAATVAISDGEAVTGNYDYAPYFSARIVNSTTDRGVVGIRALTEPGGDFSPFVGPYGAEIRDLMLKDGAILVKFTLGLEQERRARNVAITVRRLVAVAP